MTDETMVNVVLDRSGSMSGCRKSTLEGLNAYLLELKENKDQNYVVTVSLFDSEGIDVIREVEPAGQLRAIEEKEYVPRGGTPLLDAVGTTIGKVEQKAHGKASLMVIVTDGQENASVEYTRETVRQLIEQKEKDGWTFVFMGANIDAYAESGQMGIRPANVVNYAQGTEEALFRMAAQSTEHWARLRRTTGSLPQVNGEEFFDAELREKGVTAGSAGQAGPPRRRKPRRVN
jgi:uncharacterized protein YegL